MKRVFVVAIFGLALTHEARADVPGPREVCEAEGLTCETCWERYGSDAKEKETYEACAAPLREKGYTEGCRDRQGAGDQVFFCANGAKPKRVTRDFGGGGCAGCVVAGNEGGWPALTISALALAGALYRRRRQRCPAAISRP
jgi:MYXO-CTERM domain-containing protein